MTARRPRPPAPPLEVQCRVALRQLGWTSGIDSCIRLHRPSHRPADRGTTGYGRLLARMLPDIAARVGCQVKDLRLDHEPALRVRSYNARRKKIADRYTPHAHDPACLAWRPHGREFAGSHDVKTNVRGDHGQFSDTALIKRERRREGRKDSLKVDRVLIGVAVGRKLRSRASWPKGRKIPKRRRP